MLFALHHSISPAAMKALLCTRYGTPDDLTLAEIPDPVAGPGEVVVRIEAAALNFFDTLIIANKYQTKPPLPFSPAAECAGTVEALGGGVTKFAIGDRVMAYTGYGAARERIAVSAEQACQDSRQPRFGSCRRSLRDLRNHAACAERSRQAESW